VTDPLTKHTDEGLREQRNRSLELLCLLPARNCERDLPGYFESVARFADGIVALDDGSTDGTRAALEREPRVRTLLSNPRRETYAGWDDAANRSRLLEAAARLRPRWLFFLDADERLSPDDGRALRRFVETEALPGVAYGFRVHRMVDDLEGYDRSSLWVYRMFAHREGQSLPETKLHLVPVPEQIPRERWIKTTIRIQHLSSLDEPRRTARYQKYREADPDNRFQSSYRHLLDTPRYRRSWLPRSPHEPVVKETARHRRIALQLSHRSTLESAVAAAPTLAAVVIAQNDRDRIAASMDALVGQETSEPIEIILVDSGTDGTADLVRERYPQVQVVHLSEPALPGRARNAGLRITRARYVSFPGSHVVVAKGALQHRIDAHDSGAGMVTGCVLNGTPTFSGWASYFLDHSEVLPGRPSTPLTGPPSHCSYRTEALVEVGGFSEDRRVGEDTVVNTELFRRGHTAVLHSKVRFHHVSPCRNPARLARHHFQRGRGYGRILWERSEESRRWKARLRTMVWLLGTYPYRRLRFVTRNVLRYGGQLRGRYVASLPLVLLGIASAALGAFTFLLRPAISQLAPLERNRRRAAAEGGPRQGSPLGATVPTLFPIVPFALRGAMRSYVEHWGGAPGSRMEYVFLEDLVQTRELASGTYLFAGVESLRPSELALACAVAEQLSKASDRAQILNDPRRIRPQADLLERLSGAGVSRVRVVRASELPAELRFPVSLREAFGLRRILGTLLRNEAELRRALRSARRRGHAPVDLLVTEFRDAADAHGVYRHYSALRIGDEILPYDLSFSLDWHGEEPCDPCESHERERQAFLEALPHEELLRLVYEIAGIDFGRIDFSLLDGELQVWGLCTNPTLGGMRARLTLGFEAVDTLPDSLEPVPIRIDPAVADACERDWRRLKRRAAFARAVDALRPADPARSPRVDGDPIS